MEFKKSCTCRWPSRAGNTLIGSEHVGVLKMVKAKIPVCCRCKRKWEIVNDTDRSDPVEDEEE